MARRRVGVALLLDPPVADEVDGLRRALGATDLARLAPHVTLVRPINLRAADLPAALERLRAAAGAAPAPLRLSLGLPATFAPANPVLHLQVGGDLPTLRALQQAVTAPPLDRPSPWPYVPHVTLLDGVGAELEAAAIAALGRYAAVVDVDRVVLLEERVGGPPGAGGPGADGGPGRGSPGGGGPSGGSPGA
ncbi:MAG TPA: 2'-5' RNA ligase family protein, partial [Acidimicrobiales bacterium]|nr:2'-5' RNA ligase family protein [Acidimicrobiales bacterium]